MPHGGDPTNMTPDQILVFHRPTRQRLQRLQRLLADRFSLELEQVSQPMPIFVLVPGKSGSKLKPCSTTGDPEMAPITVFCSRSASTCRRWRAFFRKGKPAGR
jgi:uncharacterized protein (TIGR03435 family)